jgi:hypothetical protein
MLSVTPSGALALALAAATALALLDLVAAERPASTAGESFRYLVFSDKCFNTFFTAHDFFNVACLKQTVSKLLGYGIIAGACVVKVPQIFNFLRAGSVAGVSREAVYLELLGYLVSSVYHIVQGNPFSAYGETVIITAQSLLIAVMLWAYDPPGVAHVLGVSGALAALTQAAYVAPKAYRPSMQYGTMLLFVVSRGWQVVANFRQAGTGQLAFLTLFMNFAGSAARIFTSSQEVKEPEVLISFIVSTALNAMLLAQYVQYNLLTRPRVPAGGERAARTTARAQAPVPAPAPAPVSGTRRSSRKVD